MNRPSPVPWIHLARSIDLRLRDHQIILAISALGGALSLIRILIQGEGFLAAIGQSISVALATFLGWVIGREADPDYQASAHLGALLTLAAGLVLGPAGLLPSFAAIMFMRLVNRSTGLAASTLDSFLILGLSLWGGLAVHPVLLLLGAAAFILDGWLQPVTGKHLVFGGVSLAVGIVMGIVTGASLIEPPPTQALLLGLIPIAAFALAVVTIAEPQSVADYTGQPLAQSRTRAGQWLLGAIALALILTLGVEGIRKSVPLLGASLGVAGYHLVRRLQT